MAARDWFAANPGTSRVGAGVTPIRGNQSRERAGSASCFSSNPGAISWRSSDKRAYPQRVEGRSRASGRRGSCVFARAGASSAEGAATAFRRRSSDAVAMAKRREQSPARAASGTTASRRRRPLVRPVSPSQGCCQRGRWVKAASSSSDPSRHVHTLCVRAASRGESAA